MEKLCGMCKTTKEVSEFYRDKSRGDGLTPYCKACVKALAARPPRRKDPEGMKRCQICKETKPIDDFHRSSKTFDSIAKICKPCAYEQHRRWRQTNPEYVAAKQKKWRDENPERRADYERKKNYGIPHGTYDAMLAAQGGVCAICRNSESTKTKRFLSVDHCHTTGKVRGLLCGNCNNGLGRFKENPDALEAAAAYIRKHLNCDA